MKILVCFGISYLASCRRFHTLYFVFLSVLYTKTVHYIKFTNWKNAFAVFKSSCSLFERTQGIRLQSQWIKLCTPMAHCQCYFTGKVPLCSPPPKTYNAHTLCVWKNGIVETHTLRRNNDVNRMEKNTRGRTLNLNRWKHQIVSLTFGCPASKHSATNTIGNRLCHIWFSITCENGSLDPFICEFCSLQFKIRLHKLDATGHDIWKPLHTAP